MTTEYNEQKLLKTADASRILAVSTKTLRRYRDMEGGFLIQDKDWFFGAFDNSPIRWDIERCKEALSKRRRGFSKYQDFQLAKKILEDQQKK
tara:strand:+ start:3918 stop:4193 length:276 start_codon:yes stop_codon:yes gene_type:complete